MYRIGHATEDSVTVWARHTSGGLLTLSVNGQTFSGTTIDTLVSDGTGTVTATGLKANTQYSFELAVDEDVIHSGSFKTMPKNGDSFSILWAYCWHPIKAAFAIEHALNKHNDIAAFFMGGDNIYSDGDTSTTTTSINGESIKNISAIMQADPDDTDAARNGLRAMYRSRFKEYATKRAIESLPTYPLVSDHDMQTGDNWDINHTTAAANAYITWASTQAQAEAVYDVHKEVFWEYYKGTPLNTDANNDSSRADDEQFYFDFIIGDAHIFCLDANNHKDRVLGVDYGATQVTWMTSRLSASTSKWKIICTGEGIAEYSASVSTDHQTIIDHITNNSITGCLMIAGDIHAPFYGEYGIPVVRSGQVTQNNHTAIPNGYLGNTRYKWLGYNSNGVGDKIGPHAVAVLKVTPEHLDVDFLNDEGMVFFSRRLMPDKNEFSQVLNRFG